VAHNDKYTAEMVVEAIRGEGRWREKGSSGGIVSVVANRLGCQRNTVYSYAKRYKGVKGALEEARATIVDRAEGELSKAVADGNLTAIIFTLKTLGKERGYVERVQVEEYVEAELEAVRAALEDSLEPHEFRKVTGILSRIGSA
jgi:hypothetical protein